jgi:hypothetical protein
MEFVIPDYARRMISAIKRNADLFPKRRGGIHHFVFHDAWCSRLVRPGEACASTPNVEVEIKGHRDHILAEGKARGRRAIVGANTLTPVPFRLASEKAI